MDTTNMNQGNPLAPSSMPSVQEQLAAYRARYEQDKQDIQDAQEDPFTPTVYKEDASARQSQMDEWLEPIASNLAPPQSVNTQSGSADFSHFQEQFENDPAVQEIAEPMMGVAQQLRQAIESGQMTYQEAMQQAAQMMDSYVTPVLDKHHGDRAKSRTLLSRSPQEVAESFGAQVQKHADGRKARADVTLNKGE